MKKLVYAKEHPKKTHENAPRNRKRFRNIKESGFRHLNDDLSQTFMTLGDLAEKNLHKHAHTKKHADKIHVL